MNFTPSSVKRVKATRLLEHEEINTSEEFSTSEDEESEERIRTSDVTAILRNYFHTTAQCNSIFDILEKLPIEGSISLRQLFCKVSSKSRPNHALSIEMLEDLQRNNLFKYFKERQSIIIMKGDRYRTT